MALTATVMSSMARATVSPTWCLEGGVVSVWMVSSTSRLAWGAPCVGVTQLAPVVARVTRSVWALIGIFKGNFLLNLMSEDVRNTVHVMLHVHLHVVHMCCICTCKAIECYVYYMLCTMYM